MDVSKINEEIESSVIQFLRQQVLGRLGDQPASEVKVREVVDQIRDFNKNIPSVMDYEDLKKLIGDVSPKLRDIGIFFSFDKIGDFPVVRVKDVSGKVIKVFPSEQIAELVNRIRLFFDVLTDLLLNSKV